MLVVQAGRLVKTFLFRHLFLNITKVFCAKKRVGHALVSPRPSSRCCWQHLEEGRDEDDQLSARLYCECATRRSCDGVAAATELRRPAPSRSFCASRPRDATRRMRRPAFIFPRVDSNFNGLGPHSPRPPPWPRNSNCCCYYWT